MEVPKNHHFKLKGISRLFPSSCHFRSLPDVAQHSLVPISKSNKNVAKHRHQVKRNVSDVAKGRKGPPVTPNITSNLKRQTKLHQQLKKRIDTTTTTTTTSNTSDNDDDDEKDTFFSLYSTSFSSLTSFDTRRSTTTKKEINNGQKLTSKINEVVPDEIISTEVYYSHNGKSSQRRRKSSRKRCRRIKKKRNVKSTLINVAMIEDSYAVEKSPKDPRGDFRSSMLEMIVEKQMFGKRDLDRLLKCFLSLNAVEYHGIILNVFYEICETLFSN